ncbi:MAG: DNA repair protein RadC [Minisyncoccia bacterium]
MRELKMIQTGQVSEKLERYTSPNMVFNTCRDMANLDREHFVVLHLDGKNRVTAKETVSIGSLNQAIVHPREVFKAAVHNGSAALICVHNHPTGDPEPSTEDLAITWRLCQAGDIIGIKVLDHIIVGQSAYFSFAENGHMNGRQVTTASPAFKKEQSQAEQPINPAGEIVRELRKRAKMSQKKLVDATGIHQSYVSQIENGSRKMTESEAQKIATVFDIDYKKLLHLQSPQNRQTCEV